MALTVLSVEDDDAVHFLIKTAFQEMGSDFCLYRVINASEALSFLKRNNPFADAPTPHLILSNLNMPGMSGIELLAILRKHDSWKEIPVVVFSSSNLDSDRARCLAEGARQYITKPYDYQDFLSAVKSACGFISDAVKAASN